MITRRKKKKVFPTPLVIPRSEHSLSRKDIDPDALKVMMRLHRHGFKAYLVGGGVRDLLLNKRPKDFDISTDAHPGQIKALFRNCRIIGRRFRLAHIHFGRDKIIEVSTFRKNPPPTPAEGTEAEGVRTRGDNTFGEPYEDAVRRDLTINGLFYDIATFSILDYVGGMADLKGGIIRTIGNPDERFREDPIRMLRVVRHTVGTGFRIEKQTRAALLRNAHLLKESNPSRLQDEVRRDFLGPAFSRILRLQHELGLLAAYFPELAAYLDRPMPPEGSLFPPSWIWDALAFLDRPPGDAELAEEFRLLSILLPLLEVELAKRGAETSPLLAAALSEPSETNLFFRRFSSPFAVPRRKHERLRTTLSAWLRLLEFIQVQGRIPLGFQRKAYFGKVVQWHLFHQSLIGRAPAEVRRNIQQAIEAGRSAPSGRAKSRRRRRRRPRSSKRGDSP